MRFLGFLVFYLAFLLLKVYFCKQKSTNIINISRRKMNKLSFLFASLLFFGGLTATAADVYTIYPIPQSQVAGQGSVRFSQQVTLVCDTHIDQATRARAVQVLQGAGLTPLVAEKPSATGSNLYLAVSGHDGLAEQKATALRLNRAVLKKEGKFDRHILHLFNEGEAAQVVIVGETSDAAFYALASLEQMLERGTQNLPCVTLNDYADQQSRGLVEGYYGYPYTVAVKKDLMRFMMRMKMNTYMYGAKSDVYHSADWEKPYPTRISAEQRKNGLLTQDDIKDIAATSAATKVNFIWAIHPGNDFVKHPTVVRRIMSKFDNMYKLGVRQFAVFVDDVGVPDSEQECQTNADRLTAVQKAIDKKWNTEGATPESRVKPLHFVPQVYTLSWVSEPRRKRFYKALQSCPDKITIYITGAGVWSVPNSGDLAVTKRELGRNVAWWWNYPCNDNADEQVYPSDMYTNFMEMRSVDTHATMPKALENGLGIVSNPMQQGEVSKTALFSVADYAWNNDAFDNKKSWEASFSHILNTPEKRMAYKTLIPYIRWNDPTEMQAAISAFKAGNTQRMSLLLDKLASALQTMLALKDSQVESDRLLYADLAPWLAKLHAMVGATRGMIEVNKAQDRATKWEKYVQASHTIASLDTDEAFTAYALEGLGHGISVSKRQCAPAAKYFFPFMATLNNEGLGRNFFGTTTKDIEVVKSSEQLRGEARLFKGKAYLTLNNSPLPPRSYIGMMFKEPVRPARIEAQPDLLERYNFLYSANGKDWTRLTPAKLSQHDWVKYLVCYNNTESEQSLTLSAAQLSLTLPEQVAISNIDVPVNSAGNGGSNSSLGKKAIIDGDPHTFFASNKNQARDDTYTLHLASPTDVKDVRLYFGTLNGDHLQAGRVEASVDGKTWISLRVKGRNTVTGGINEATDYAPNVKYLDFVGQVKAAKFLRLVVTNPQTNKWLRLYDIQVNLEHYQAQFAPNVTDARGTRLDAATDKKGTTAIDEAKGGSLVYEFQQLAPLCEVQIYWNQQGGEVKVELWNEATHTWTSAGTLGHFLSLIDLSAQPNVLKMRLSWQGTQVPGIYEIVEVAQAEGHSILSGLSSLPFAIAPSTSLHIHDLQGCLLRTDGNTQGLPAGIYIVGGRKVRLR